MGALIGKKLGMTQVYNDREDLTPVTDRRGWALPGGTSAD